jgi:protein subunit release factor A
MTETELLKRLERCFDDGELETFVNWAPASGLAVSSAAAAVKVVHRPTGIEAVSGQFRSQVRNKTSALLAILQRLHDSPTGLAE